MALYLALLILAASGVVVRAEDSDKETDVTIDDYVPYLAASKASKTSQMAHKALFYDFFPSNLQEQKPQYLEIRSLFSGSVQVIESAQFGILVNISGKSSYELASVQVEYTSVDDTILLQLKSEAPSTDGGLSSLVTLAIVVGACMAVALIVTSAYLCFWLVKFEESPEYESPALSTPSTDTFGSLSYTDIDTNSLIKSWQEEGWIEDDAEVKEMTTPSSIMDSIQSGMKGSHTGNGDINRSLQLASRRPDSSSDNNTNKPPSAHRRQRYRAANQKSRDISSSDDLSSIDDNWTKRKASWKKGNAEGTILERSDSDLSAKEQLEVTHVAFHTASARRAQFSDREFTSADAGFSSGNEYRPSRNRNYGARADNNSLDELEWDEYETGDGTLPPPSVALHGWQLSTDEEKTQEHPWPPPMNQPPQFSDESDREGADDSDREGAVNLEDVREAIHNAMDSVNSDIQPNRAAAASKMEPSHDDGYETGVAANGLNAAGAVVAPPPPVATKPTRNRSGGGGGGSRAGPSKLSTTVMVSITLLGLIAGVLGVVSNLTEANIVIYLPDNFFKEVNFFINESSRIDLDISRKPENTKVHLFEISNPIITNLEENKCDGSKQCAHGCNRKTGVCSCTKGYVLFEETKCTDKKDCLYLPCRNTETCSNTIGGYICTCADDYWRDETGTCVLCAETTCPPDTFEASTCPDRVCKACSNGCADGKYITHDCTTTADTVCAECDPPCMEDEFEYKPCTNYTNRKCGKTIDLAAALGSSNLILESLSNRRIARSTTWLMDTPHQVQQFTTGLVRGSGINIEVVVQTVNLYPTVQSVDHPDSNDNEEFAANGGPPNILTTYCKYPLPTSYEILSVEHSNVTAAKRPNCPDCMIDPRRPCRTYKDFGRAAPLHPFNKSMVCSEPDVLADMFDLNGFLSQSNSIVVQPTKECEVYKNYCYSCSQTCADEMVREQDTNCSITSEDDPNSWSPRLMNCQNCCLSKRCRDQCATVQQCQPVSCWTGNVAEFLLSAKFPQKMMEYYCDVDLDREVELIALSYSVSYNATVLKNFSISILQNESTVTQNSYSDGLLTIDYTTGIDSIPDLIHGELNMENLSPNFTAGRYRPQGDKASKVDVSRVDIVPTSPFAFSTKWWNECLANRSIVEMQNCSKTIVDRFLISNGDPMMRPYAEISVSDSEPLTYSLWNKSRQPFVEFRVPVDVSVIQKLYPPTTVDASSLNARISRYNGGWRLVVDGRVKKCPGYFVLKVWELNKKTPLADYELAVHKREGQSCQHSFFVKFNIAGGEVNRIIKRQLRVEIVDSNGRRHFIQAESEPPTVKKISDTSTSSTTSPTVEADLTKEMGKEKAPERTVILIMGPFLLVIGVTMIVLSIAWIVSVVIPRDHGPVKSTPQCRAAFFLFYAMFRVVYMFGTSLSIFAFIWYSINVKDLVIVQNYMSAVDTVVSQEQYDLRTLVDFSTQTVATQQQDFKLMRAKCFENIEMLQNESQQMIQELSEGITDELTSLPVRNELITSLDERARDLQVELEALRQNYNNYALISSQKLELEISKTIEDFEKTEWLSAARTIRGSVLSKGKTTTDAVNGFQKWLGLRTQLHSIQNNFVMDPLPISGIDTLALPPIPAPPTYKPVDLQAVFMPTHNLYSEMKAPQVSRADAVHRLYGISLSSRMSMLTVLVVLLLLDFLMLTSRIAETLDTGQQILDGYVVQKTYKETYQDGCSSEKYIVEKLTKKPHRVRYRLYKLILETGCVPLLIALGTVLGITFISLLVGLDFVSMETLTNVGLFSSLVGPWNLTSNIALDNIQMNIERINGVDIPSTNSTLNYYIERLEALNNIANNLSYYQWQIECGDSPSSWCGEFNYSRLVKPLNIKDMNCSLQPIKTMGPSDMPRTLTNTKVQELIQPYASAFGWILESSASLLLTYTSYILIVKMLSAVLWNFLTRTAYLPGVRVVITNELASEEKEERTEPDDTTTHIKFNRNTIEELSQEDSLDYDDGGLSDDPHESGCPLSEELIPNGGHTNT